MTNPPEPTARVSAPAGAAVLWLAVVAAVGVPASLLWDYSWEFTIGVETMWAAPHLATYAATALAVVAALGGIFSCTGKKTADMRLGRLRGPLGAWLMLWGGLAYATAVIFDRWWQLGYGQAAGIWHPPQWLKATGFFAVLIGAWILAAVRQGSRGGAWAYAIAGGALLAMIFAVTLPWNLANQQHSAVLYQIACGTYPVVLVVAALDGRWRWSATATALCFTAIAGAAVWLLPLQAAVPQAGPIFNPRDHLLPTPFPLLLVVPAVALDLLLRVFPAQRRAAGRSVEVAVAFFFAFAAAQWPFAKFLLSAGADHWFFAGGGRHWPPVQAISEPDRVRFWPGWEFNAVNAGIALGLAVVAAALGLWLGVRVRRGEEGPGT